MKSIDIKNALLPMGVIAIFVGITILGIISNNKHQVRQDPQNQHKTISQAKPIQQYRPYHYDDLFQPYYNDNIFKFPRLRPFDWHNHYFDDIFDNNLRLYKEWNFSNSPNLDIESADNKILITADVPGYSDEDIDIEVQENYLIIKGKTESENEEKDKNYYHQERSTGSFYRKLPLPASVDTNNITTNVNDGVLKVSLIKK